MRYINEENEDEDKAEDAAEEKSTDEESSKEEENDSKSEDGEDESKEDEDKDLTSDEPFAAIDLRFAHCFGYTVPANKNWVQLAKQAKMVGWKGIDINQLELNLAKDVEDSYMQIAKFRLVNIDDETSYDLVFDNSKAMWDLDITESPNAEIDITEKSNFFKSEMFKKITKKTYARLMDAKQIYEEVVQQHTEKGELLKVDDVKLMAILHFLDTDMLMQNLLDGKFISL